MLYTQGKTQCNPAEIGYDEKRLVVLNEFFQTLIDDGEIQCAMYCLSRRGKVFAQGAVGRRIFDEDCVEAAQPDSVRYIASITKVFVAVAIMKLVEDGLTRLEVPLGEILPQFNSSPFNGIALFHLLTHTSGMHPDGGCFNNKHDPGGYWHFIETAYEAYKNDKSEDKGEFDWISAALAHGVRMEPDKQWLYCSFGFVILGEIIHKLTGIHAHKYIEDFICKPLGLKDTAFELTPEMAKRYIIPNQDTREYINDIISGKQSEKDMPWAAIPSTGGGMKSTAYDLMRFGNAIMFGGSIDGARILGRKAVEKMLAPAIHGKPDYCWGANESDRQYGIGFDLRDGAQFTLSPGSYQHGGAGHCELFVDPKEELVAAWFVPYAKDGWFPRATWNVHNIIWSGLL
ncbi:MAG: beta-lactamase family protein [Oscillospiraceae bacterium]|nr:beta-lactamase family protein [Oscillospiraceae bacterium]